MWPNFMTRRPCPSTSFLFLVFPISLVTRPYIIYHIFVLCLLEFTTKPTKLLQQTTKKQEHMNELIFNKELLLALYFSLIIPYSII